MAAILFIIHSENFVLVPAFLINHPNGKYNNILSAFSPFYFSIFAGRWKEHDLRDKIRQETLVCEEVKTAPTYLDVDQREI